MTRWEWNSRRATAVTSRIVTAAIAMAICTVSWADYWQPVKAEIVEIGFSLPFYSAETRVVPGVAGIWTGAGAQVFVRDDILAKERAGTPDCAAPSITNTFVAAPDMIATHKNGRSTSHFLQTWTVDRCGTAVTYAVEYIEAPGQAVRVRIEPAAELFADAGTDMFYAKLKEAAAQRERDRASGDWADLNLPMPPGWHALVAMPSKNPARFAYVPPGQTAKNWRSKITITVIGGDSLLSPLELVEGARKAGMSACPMEQDPVVVTPVTGSSVLPGAKVLLVCERRPKSKLADVMLAKAVAGKHHLYLVQQEWSVPAGDRAAILKSLEVELATAEAMLGEVRLCNPASDPANCPSPFFL